MYEMLFGYQVGKRMVIEYYNDTMIYTHLYRDKDFKIRYRQGERSVTMREFQTYEVHVCDDLEESNGNNCHASRAGEVQSTMLY